MKINKTKNVFVGLVSVTVFIFCILRANTILAHKWAYYENIEFRKTQLLSFPDKTVDIIFLGSSATYSGFSPALLYGESNLYSFNLATSQQPPLGLYLNLKEALLSSAPKLVVVDFSFLFTEHDLENPVFEPYYQKSYVDIQSPDLKKEFIDFIKEDYPDFDILSIQFPLYRYHDRWKDLRKIDFEGLEPGREFLLGSLSHYKMQRIAIDPDRMDYNELTNDLSINKKSTKYYDLVISLCKSNDIKVISIIPPRKVENYERNYFHELYAKKHNIDFINFNDPKHFDLINFDLDRDFYDESHVNAQGQVKLTNYIGNYIISKYPEVQGSEREATPIYVDFYNQYMDYTSNLYFSYHE